jgi:membrane-associated phospholipid phosphatase
MQCMEGHPARSRRLTRAVVYGVAVAVPIGVLAFLVRTQFDPMVDLDQRVILAATDFTRSHPGFRSFAETWELVSQPWVMYLLLGVPLCLFAWFRLKLRTRAMWALATMATGWAVAIALKTVVQRARPAVEDPFAVHAGYSFPSGHTTNNAIVVTIILLLLRPVLGVTARRVLLAVGALWVLLTCADRLFMGAHFLSDVIAGVLLGCGLCIASYAGYVGWSPPTTPTTPSKESADGVPHQVA